MGKKIITEILKMKYFEEKPPILIDVGASGKLRKIWKNIAPFSIYIGFDADTRDFKVEEGEKSIFKKSYLINRIVSDKEGVKKFYLTKEPHCSSVLEPDLSSLSKYHIRSYFEIENVIELPAVNLQNVLDDLGIAYVDWFKTDTQGTDLKVFSSINKNIRDKILVAEFEPGIMDAYKGEDKLYKIMEFLDEEKKFWCDECIVKGMVRMKEENFKRLNKFIKRFFYCFDKPSAFWAEISFMNNMNGNEWTKRDYLLMIVFSIIKKHYGFAIEISDKALEVFEDEFFQKIKSMIWSLMKIKGFLNFPLYVLKRISEKLEA